MKTSKPVKPSRSILETAAVAIGSTLGTLAKTVGLAEAPGKATKTVAKKKVPAKGKTAMKKTVATKKKAPKRKSN